MSISLHSDLNNLKSKWIFSGKTFMKAHCLVPLQSVLGDKTCYLAVINQSLQGTVRPLRPGTKRCYLIVLILLACTGLCSIVNLPVKLTALCLLTARINHGAHFLLSPRQHLVFSSKAVPLPSEQSGVPKSIRLDISVG